MEDILASIRRILNEDEAPPGAQAHVPDEPAPLPPPRQPAGSGEEEEGDDGVLMLDEAMLVSESVHEPPPPALPVEPDPPPLAVVQMERGPDPVVPPPPPMPEPPVSPSPLPSPPGASGIMAPESAAAASASVGSLLRSLSQERTTQVHRGGPTIEDLVREELRPLLKDWLDHHLPPLVERLVRLEIERVAGRAEL